jgi:hypothetical protein
MRGTRRPTTVWASIAAPVDYVAGSGKDKDGGL